MCLCLSCSSCNFKYNWFCANFFFFVYRQKFKTENYSYEILFTWKPKKVQENLCASFVLFFVHHFCAYAWFSYLYYLLSCLFIGFVRSVATFFCCFCSSTFATKSFICWPCISIACIVSVMSIFLYSLFLFFYCYFVVFFFFLWLTTTLRMESESIKEPLFSLFANTYSHTLYGV